MFLVLRAGQLSRQSVVSARILIERLLPQSSLETPTHYTLSTLSTFFFRLTSALWFQYPVVTPINKGLRCNVTVAFLFELLLCAAVGSFPADILSGNSLHPRSINHASLLASSVSTVIQSS